jgi:hypothetical protein
VPAGVGFAVLFEGGDQVGGIGNTDGVFEPGEELVCVGPRFLEV